MVDLESKLDGLSQKRTHFENPKIPITGGKTDLIPNVEESDRDLIWDLSRHWRCL
jgi:hypothetical protein